MAMNYTVFHATKTGGRVITAATAIAAKAVGRKFRSEGHIVIIRSDFVPAMSLDEFERLHPDGGDI